MARGLIKRTLLKAGLLIAPKEHWPPFEGGLSMELAGVTPGGHQLFRYIHSAAYHVKPLCIASLMLPLDLQGQVLACAAKLILHVPQVLPHERLLSDLKGHQS